MQKGRYADWLAINSQKINQGKAYQATKASMEASPEYKNASPDQKIAMQANIAPGYMITQDTINHLAERVNAGAPNPFRSGIQRDRVNVAAAVLSMNKGQTGAGAVADISSVKAKQMALNAISKTNAATEKYEATVQKNVGIIEKQMPTGEISDLGPALNNWVRSGQVEAGNEHAPAYIQAVVTVANEYAKVMSGASGAGGSTVDARQHANELLSAGFNSGQIKNVIKNMRQEMRNQVISNYEQERSLKRSIAMGDFDTPDQVKAAVGHGIDESHAIEILQDQFGYEE
jgi:hypothetical protein